jgi:menaquinone-dependent protoporphyrinogen IX oxidase
MERCLCDKVVRCAAIKILSNCVWFSRKRRKKMNKILVTYATRAGSTYEVAARVAEVLHTQGAAVDVKPVTAMHELQGYDAIVVGSAIRMGCWLPEAVEFVKTNRETLSRIPTAYFLIPPRCDARC